MGVNTIENVYPLFSTGKKKTNKNTRCFRVSLQASRITHMLKFITLKLVMCKKLVSCEHKIC